MSVAAISAVDADLAHVESAQLRLAAALAEEAPVGGSDPTEVQHGHAAVASAEAALVWIGME